MKLKSTLENFHSKLWKYYVPIPKEIGDQFIEGKNRRVLCGINGGDKAQCALMHKEGEFFILINNAWKKKITAHEGDEVTVEIEKDRSEFGHQVPEAFEALLAQDDKGRECFYKLTKGKQRSLIYIVKKVKNVDSQIAKGLAIMHHLKEAEGQLDYKRLNELIKEYNRRK